MPDLAWAVLLVVLCLTVLLRDCLQLWKSEVRVQLHPFAPPHALCKVACPALLNLVRCSGDAYTDWVLASALPLFPSTYFGTRFIDQPRWGRTKGNAVMYGLVCVVMALGAFFPSIATPMSM